MSYLVLARKYRPQHFDEVIKQEHVTQTLKNAISAGRVAHAILFSGPRGTGKTTIARILAKAMNCVKGPTPVPCNSCRSCREITFGNAADVIEIDGASNNGVDHIRELRDNVRYMPAHSTYKIYIIDEVHMLSVAAFNALLKTLEEPPAHVLFFFATTEPHKIPITILSRCQRHELRHIDLESIKTHLLEICKQENIQITEESLEIIARESGGSMRDAISLLDQVILCSEGLIHHDQVLDILGLIDQKTLFDISSGIFKGDLAELLSILDSIYARGRNLKEFYSDLIEHFRNLLVIKIGKKSNLLMNVPIHEQNFMQQQVQNVSIYQLSRILDILSKEEMSVRLASRPKLAIEMVFIRLLEAKPILPMDVLIEKLDELKKLVTQTSGYPEIKPSEHKFNEDQKNYEPALVLNQQKSQPDLEKNVNIETTQQTQASSHSAAQGDTTITPETALHRLVSSFADKYPSLAASLEKCTVKKLDDRKLEIEATSNGFTIKNIRKNISMLENTCCQLFGRKIEIVINEKKQEMIEPEKAMNMNEILKQEAINHPMVSAAMQIFKGKIIDVKILQETQRRNQ